jgi:glycosyltransferase involved in cell wall biosynthesis
LNTLVTVVTPCYNSAAFIEDTIKSVLSQAYSKIEYIVVDGQSTDATLDIVHRYVDRLKLISEPDNGQADAINKGWRIAKGEILAWLNADDLYCLDTVETAVKYLDQNPDAGWSYGSARFLDANGEPFPFRNFIYAWDYDLLLTSHVYITQPSVFIRREVVGKFGYLREDLHYGMDYEYWLRIGKTYPGHYVPEIQVQVKWHSRAKTASGGKRRILELDRLVREYGGIDFPSLMRYEWADAYLGDSFKQLTTRNWGELAQDVRALGRYPFWIPRAILKNIMRWLLPPKVETKVRQWLALKGLLPS